MCTQYFQVFEELSIKRSICCHFIEFSSCYTLTPPLTLHRKYLKLVFIFFWLRHSIELEYRYRKSHLKNLPVCNIEGSVDFSRFTSPSMLWLGKFSYKVIRLSGRVFQIGSLWTNSPNFSDFLATGRRYGQLPPILPPFLLEKNCVLWSCHFMVPTLDVIKLLWWLLSSIILKKQCNFLQTVILAPSFLEIGLGWGTIDFVVRDQWAYVDLYSSSQLVSFSKKIPRFGRSLHISLILK